MSTKTESLEVYKEAIKAKFEEEKNGIYSSFFISPSRAKLRQLCEEKLKNSINSEDLNSFKFLFGFEFDASNKNKIQANTDKFRPIETFLKGETDLTDLNAINLAAMLVDFQPRPFRIFANKEGFDINEGVRLIKTQSLIKTGVEESKSIISLKETNQFDYRINKNFKRKISIGVLSLIGVSTIGYTAKDIISPDAECMQWQKDHYEIVDCQSGNSKGFMSQSEIVPFNENQSQLVKIEITDTTTFFKNRKPLYWYSKVNGKPEFFNTHGLHPETYKALRPVSEYIVAKYVEQ
jgi:hypothetical protein